MSSWTVTSAPAPRLSLVSALDGCATASSWIRFTWTPPCAAGSATRARRRSTPPPANASMTWQRTRFKPGVSGNPKGRPKGSKSLRKELENELGELIAIDGADKRKKIPLRRLILKQLVRLAAKGDLKGIAM